MHYECCGFAVGWSCDSWSIRVDKAEAVIVEDKPEAKDISCASHCQDTDSSSHSGCSQVSESSFIIVE